MGLIEPRLQASGKDSLDRIELNSVVRCATRLLLKSSNSTGGRPSGPGALCRFNLLMAINTSSSFMKRLNRRGLKLHPCQIPDFGFNFQQDSPIGQSTWESCVGLLTKY